MSFMFTTWGQINLTTFQQKATEIPDGKLKSEISKMYKFQNALFFISGGELYKEGELKYESKMNDDHKMSAVLSPLVFKGVSSTFNLTVQDLSCGVNHTLISTKVGLTFSLGENYYGQLGLGSYFVPYTYEPHMVKLGNIEEILAYGNNSFGIDTSRKLWVWGKSDLLGFNYEGNLFKPTQILSHQFIDKIKINSGRIIVEVRHYKDKKKEIVITKKEKEAATQGGNPNITSNKKEISMDDSRLSRPTGSIAMNRGATMLSAASFNNNNNADDASGTLNQAESEKKKLIDDILRVDGHLNKFFDKVTYETRSNYKNIMSYISQTKEEMNKFGWDNLRESVDKIIKPPETTQILISEKAIINNTKSFADNIKEVDVVFNCLLTGRQIELKNYNKNIEYNFLNEKLNSNQLTEITKTMQDLLNYNLNLKKGELLVYRILSMQFLYESPKYFSIVDALHSIKSRDDFIERKLALICKYNESIKLNLSRCKSFKRTIDEIFNMLPTIFFNSSSEDQLAAERFFYKYIIDISNNIKLSLETLLSTIESEKDTKDILTTEGKLLEKYKELYGVHIYLNTLGIKGNDKKKEKETDQASSFVIEELDGVMNKLENVIAKKLETKSVALTNELLLYYSYSLLDIAHLKKYIAMIQRHLVQQTMKNREFKC